MNERVERSGLTRRQLFARVSVGLAGGTIASLLAACGPSSSGPSAPAAQPTQAAGGAAKPAATTGAAQQAPAAQTSGGAAATTLKVLMWQGPTILNGHLSSGTKDSIASRFCCEPLLTVDANGKFSPVLAAEVPSKDNNGISADGKTITYKLKPNVKWADGQPFTADDVVFTYQYTSNKESATVTLGSYIDLDRVEAVDPMTVRLTFKQPTGGWYVPFTGTNGLVLPKHVLSEFNGSQSRNAPWNLKAFGTGPFMVEEFRPGDLVTLVPNPNYREQGKPFFKRVEIKGGGDAVSAARAVFETGDYDYAWNLQVEAQVLQQMMGSGKGDLLTPPGSGVEQIYMNQADPNQEIDGERSNPKSQHPFLTDIKVRQAMAMAIDRDTMAKTLYGETGAATGNVLTTPTNLASKNTKYEFNIDKANQMLDEAGYKRGGDGIRMTPQGVRMKVLYQTSINSLRQKEQALVKDGWQKIGIDTELKSVDASVFFSTDPGNPDTTNHFYVDTEMFTSTFDSPSPVRYMERFYAGNGNPDLYWAQKSNQWAGQNYGKWKSDEYDKVYDQAKVETDVNKAAQLWIQANDLIVNNYFSVPLVDRKFAEGKSKSLKGPDPGPFDCVFAWNVAEWTRA